MQSAKGDESYFANYLFEKSYLPGPIKCVCGGTSFVIYKDSTNQTSGCSFRCPNTFCRRRYPIKINSLFEKFAYIRLDIMAEVINCFICLELNAKKAKKYLLIYKYQHIVYETEIFGEKDKNSFFAIDESLFWP